MWIWARKLRDIHQHILATKTSRVSAGHESACKERADSDTPLCTFLCVCVWGGGLTCVFRLQGLFGFMPHGFAVLLQLVVPCLLPWAWTDFQKVPTVYQELQVFVTLQTCGEDKDKMTHLVILYYFLLKGRFVADFPHHNILSCMKPKTNKRIVLSLCGPIEEGTLSWVQLLRKKTWF